MALKKNPFRPHTSCEKMKTEFLIVSVSAGRMLSEVFTPGEISEIAPSISSSTFSSTPPIPGRLLVLHAPPKRLLDPSLFCILCQFHYQEEGREGREGGREGGRRENSRDLEGQQVKPVKLNRNLFFMYLSSWSPFWNSLLCSSWQWTEDTFKIREPLLPLCCMCVVLTFLHINEVGEEGNLNATSHHSVTFYLPFPYCCNRRDTFSMEAQADMWPNPAF